MDKDLNKKIKELQTKLMLSEHSEEYSDRRFKEYRQLYFNKFLLVDSEHRLIINLPLWKKENEERIVEDFLRELKLYLNFEYDLTKE